MVDTKEFEKLLPVKNNNYNSKVILFIRIIPLLIIISGTILSGGRPEIILLSILIGIFAFLFLSSLIQSTNPLMREYQFRELQSIVYQMNIEIEELKDMKK